MKDEYISLQQASVIVMVSEKAVRIWVKRGWLPAVRMGPRLIRILKQDVEFLFEAIKKQQRDNVFGNLNSNRPSIIARKLTYPSQHD